MCSYQGTTAMKKATRKELVKAIRSALNMLKACEVEDRALRRAWKASVKQIEGVIAAEPKPPRR